MLIDKKILDGLSVQAKINPRLRQALDLRNSPEDLSQRMLNALEPETIDAGKETESVLLDANGEVCCVSVEKASYHTLVCLESGSVLLESNNGKYEPQREEDMLVL